MDEAAKTSEGQGTPAAAGVEPDIEEARLRQQAIGVKLRQMFDEIVNEPVPDEFLDILRKADSGGRPPTRGSEGA